jgi:hypothetical protein
MRDRILGPWFPWIASVMAIAVVGLLAFSAAVIFPELRLTATGPDPSPTPVPSERAVSLMRIPVPANADCAGCHTVVDGTIGTRPIPRMGHALEGWADCTACHADGRLVQTAPGHDSIHRELCLTCHLAPEPGASALPRPHHVVTGAACISCHGEEAPLPTGMGGRENCWICHIDSDTRALFEDTPSSAPSP